MLHYLFYHPDAKEYLTKAAGSVILANERLKSTVLSVGRSKESRIDISDEQLVWAKAMMKKVEKEGMPPIQADGIPDAQYAKDWIEMRKNQDVTDSVEVLVIRIGDVAFVGLPGEIFNEFGKDIKEK